MGKEAALAETAQKYDLDLIYLFGSQAANGLEILQGKEVKVLDPLTDLDVGVVTRGSLPPPAARSKLYAELSIALSDIFESLPLDLVFLEENHSVFQAEIFRGRCIYASSEQRKDDYEMNVLRRAADFKPFLEKFLEDALEG
ncbi:MAG: nucleotidyltransferase domain-containing protein [Bacillota bacterium]|jgi:predicted nucleotidyltransferase